MHKLSLPPATTTASLIIRLASGRRCRRPATRPKLLLHNLEHPILHLPATANLLDIITAVASAGACAQSPVRRVGRPAGCRRKQGGRDAAEEDEKGAFFVGYRSPISPRNDGPAIPILHPLRRHPGRRLRGRLYPGALHQMLGRGRKGRGEAGEGGWEEQEARRRSMNASSALLICLFAIVSFFASEPLTHTHSLSLSLHLFALPLWLPRLHLFTLTFEKRFFPGGFERGEVGGREREVLVLVPRSVVSSWTRGLGFGATSALIFVTRSGFVHIATDEESVRKSVRSAMRGKGGIWLGEVGKGNGEL